MEKDMMPAPRVLWLPGGDLLIPDGATRHVAYSELSQIVGDCTRLGRQEAQEDGRREMMIEGNDWLILMQGRRAVRRRYPALGGLRREMLAGYLAGYKEENGE